MIDLANLRINRAIIHNIVEKQRDQEYATVIARDSVINLSDPVKDLVKQRLIGSAGKQSKAFELKIAQDGAGSFFACSTDLCELDEENFIGASKEVARLLARS